MSAPVYEFEKERKRYPITGPGKLTPEEIADPSIIPTNQPPRGYTPGSEMNTPDPTAERQLQRQQEIKTEAGLLQTEENVINPAPLESKVPKLTAPPKPKPKPAGSKPPPPTQEELLADQITQTYSSRFLNYLKHVEGNAKAQAQTGSYKACRFRIFQDPGHSVAPAIGYGHRLLPGEAEQFKNGITEEQATELLMRDVKKAELDAQKHFGAKGWAAMDQHRREMAIDFVYNLGLGREGSREQRATGIKQMKSFSRALRMGDIKAIRATYKRYYRPQEGADPRPLKQRNDPFYQTFVMPLETGEIAIGQRRESSRQARR